MQKAWTASDEQQLKALREQTGLGQAIFAKRYALSMGQVRELEGAGSGSFYSDSIKAHTGRKLLSALGYVEPPEPPPEPIPLEPQPAESEPVQLAIPVAPQAASSPEPSATETARTAPAPAEPQPPVTPEFAEDPGRDAAPQRASFVTPLTAVATVAVLAAVWFVTSPKPNRISGTSEPSVTPATAAAQPASTPADVVEADAPAPTQAASVAGVAAAKLPAGCEPASTREPTRYQSPVADKPATYVYVESIQESRVCVFDSQNQARVAVLKAGESFKLSGTAPFTVRSAQWSDLKVFFQGLRVQLEPGAAADNVVILPRTGG